MEISSISTFLEGQESSCTAITLSERGQGEVCPRKIVAACYTSRIFARAFAITVAAILETAVSWRHISRDISHM